MGHVLQDLEAEDEVIGVGGERDPLRDVVDQDVWPGERGVDLDPLVARALGEEATQSAVPRANVEHPGARGDARQRRRLAKPHPLLGGRMPVGSGDVEFGEVAGVVAQGCWKSKRD